MMTVGEMAARLVFPGLKLGWDDLEAACRLAELGVGGFCVYGGTVSGVAEFGRMARAKARGPLLLAADYEDGLPPHVEGGTAFPSNMGLGAAADECLAFEKGRLTGLEARAIGVDWVFAPVVDLAARPANPIVNIRSFGADPGLVGLLARAYGRGLRAGGALNCAKHFPGHGETELDSHLDLPVIGLGRDELLRRDLAPYRGLKGWADSVMIGHLAAPALEKDRGLPATLSAPIVSGVLRRRLGFKGLVSTDALSMHAISKRFPEAEAAERALLAGSDILLVPADPKRLAYDLMRRAEESKPLAAAVRAAHRRLEAAIKASARLAEAARPLPLSQVGCARHRAASFKMAESCLAWHRPLRSPLPAEVAYFEPDPDFPGELRGGRFVDELRKSGVRVRIGAGKGFLVAGLFVSPRAYTGRIRYDEAERRRLADAAAGAGRAAAVSFGSPFALEDAGACEAALCSFSACEGSQRAAARALAGRLAVRGRMPVALGA